MRMDVIFIIWVSKSNETKLSDRHVHIIEHVHLFRSQRLRRPNETEMSHGRVLWQTC
jgi:hypothetical protein